MSRHRLSDRFEEAMRFGFEKHRNDARKGTEIPYFSHPMAVASLVLEFGGTEDQAIAALLHDTIEDCDVTKEELQEKFGSTVALIVDQCSDSNTQPKPPWRERKERYLRHLDSADPETYLVSACDKLHNARAITRDVRGLGREVWGRFSADPIQILWYYESLAETFRRATHKDARLRPLLSDLDPVIAQMKSLV